MTIRYVSYSSLRESRVHNEDREERGRKNEEICFLHSKFDSRLDSSTWSISNVSHFSLIYELLDDQWRPIDPQNIEQKVDLVISWAEYWNGSSPFVPLPKLFEGFWNVYYYLMCISCKQDSLWLFQIVSAFHCKCSRAQMICSLKRKLPWIYLLNKYNNEFMFHSVLYAPLNKLNSKSRNERIITTDNSTHAIECREQVQIVWNSTYSNTEMSNFHWHFSTCISFSLQCLEQFAKPRIHGIRYIYPVRWHQLCDWSDCIIERSSKFKLK